MPPRLLLKCKIKFKIQVKNCLKIKFKNCLRNIEMAYAQQIREKSDLGIRQRKRKRREI